MKNKKYIGARIARIIVSWAMIFVMTFIVMLFMDTRNFKNNALIEAGTLAKNIADYDKSAHPENDYFLRRARTALLEYCEKDSYEHRYATVVNSANEVNVSAKEALQMSVETIKDGQIIDYADYWCEEEEVLDWVKGSGYIRWDPVKNGIDLSDNEIKYAIFDMSSAYLSMKATFVPGKIKRTEVIPKQSAPIDVEYGAEETFDFSYLADNNAVYSQEVKKINGERFLLLYDIRGIEKDDYVFGKTDSNCDRIPHMKKLGEVECNVVSPIDNSHNLKTYSTTNVIRDHSNTYILVLSTISILTLAFGFIVFYVDYNKKKSALARETYRKNLMNNLAHDLRTPISVVSGYAQNLMDGVLPDKNDHYIKAIKDNVDYMDEIIENVMTLSESESEDIRLNKEAFDMVELTKETWEKHKECAEEKKLTIKFTGKYEIFADKRLMKSVADNLLTNAIKYSAPETEIEVTGADKEFTVSNIAKVMPQKETDTLWEPFVKDDDSRSQRAGSGLGLAIVRSILEVHGFKGRIKAEDRKFTVEICK